MSSYLEWIDSFEVDHGLSLESLQIYGCVCFYPYEKAHSFNQFLKLVNDSPNLEQLEDTVAGNSRSVFWSYRLKSCDPSTSHQGLSISGRQGFLTCFGQSLFLAQWLTLGYCHCGVPDQINLHHCRRKKNPLWKCWNPLFSEMLKCEKGLF